MTSDERQRIDKWLWFARLARTRTLAQALAVSGGVRINREKNYSASRTVRIGDTLTIATRSGVRVLRVTAPGLRRGPPGDARLLYDDLTPPAAPAVAGPAVPPESPAGRPDKRDRRALVALKRGTEPLARQDD
jgi:ribosome-associated heat shock protein Hsp15